MAWGILAIAAGAATAAVISAFVYPAAERALQRIAVGAIGLANLFAAWLLATENTNFELVVNHTRPGLSVVRRVMGLWGGSSGSLLFFTLIMSVVLFKAPVQGRRTVLVSTTIAALSLTLLFISFPFEQLENQAIAGTGLSPILEHWAMIIHPPLLYLGLALSLVPAIAPSASAKWQMAALGVLTVALALGGFWAYEEVGWGGWWAWDPVENVALIPWLLLAVTFHSKRGAPLPEWALALVWPTVFAGTAMTRTSLRTSVHSFANAGGLGWALWPLAALTGIAAIAIAAQNTTRTTRWSLRTSFPAVTIFSIAVVVALGTFRPFLEGGTLGSFYTQYLFPVVVVALMAIGVVPNWQTPSQNRSIIAAGAGALAIVVFAGLSGWTIWWQLLLAAASGAALGGTLGGDLRSARRAVAHIGVTLILIGALGGTASTHQTIGLSEGGTLEIAGHEFENLGSAFLSDNPPVIGAQVRVDGQTILEPSLTVYVERRLRLPEVATQRGLFEDVQVILQSADDDGGVVITVNTQPMTQFVWFGATLIVLAMVLPTRIRRTRHSNDKPLNSTETGEAEMAEVTEQ